MATLPLGTSRLQPGKAGRGSTHEDEEHFNRGTSGRDKAFGPKCLQGSGRQRDGRTKLEGQAEAPEPATPEGESAFYSFASRTHRRYFQQKSRIQKAPF